MLSPPLVVICFLLTAFCSSSTTTIDGEEVVVGDLARGRRFTATSTCGSTGPETVCSVQLSSDGAKLNVSQRECTVCDITNPATSHTTEFLSDSETDGTSRTWWSAEPGIENVTLELDLGALFSFNEVSIVFRSPRPAALVIERSSDFGTSYQPYQYFSSNCEEDFGIPDSTTVQGVNDVICTSQYSSLQPLTDGQVVYRPLPSSPNESDYMSPVIINKTTITNLRIRLLRLNVLPGDDLSDPITAQSYHYSIYSIVVNGSCFCNGHTQACRPSLSDDINTEPLTEVMVHPQCDCTHNTTGTACQDCLVGFYRDTSVADSDPAVCTPCNCYPLGTVRGEGECAGEGGRCECVDGVMGTRCDKCPLGSVGPDRDLASSPCTDCFCNGYLKRCSSDDGWYQANVVAGFSGRGLARDEFRSDGEIFAHSGCLEFDSAGSSLYISFPDRFHGDKRTSYNQLLRLNLSIPNMSPSDRCHVFLEVVGRFSRYRQVTLVAELPPPSNQPQLIEFPLVPGRGVQVDLWFWKRLANQRDIRQILSNIRQFRLKAVFQPGTPPLTVRLCGVSLGYATDDLSDPGITVPLKPVRYVERCDCPLNRQGVHCQNCAPGYTTDPSFGGEFARCVRCFCNFHSSSCDPVSGECFNCSDHTEGPDCERCGEGYFRNSSLRTDPCVECECSIIGTVGGACRQTLGECLCKEGYNGARCDRCSDGYWSPSLGECIPCECDKKGSQSTVCNMTTGVCLCLSRVTGEKCDRCVDNSTDIFPSCQSCDQCTDQWLARINPLRAEVQNTLELVGIMTMTPGPEGVPLLAQLIALLDEVRLILDASLIDSDLAVNTTHLHARLCELTNQTQELFNRIAVVEDEIMRFDQNVDHLDNDTSHLVNLLMELDDELNNLSTIFGNITVPDVDVETYLSVATAAEEKGALANELISRNVTRLISLSEELLMEYERELNESGFIDRQTRHLGVITLVTQRVSEYRVFVEQANLLLCGTLLQNGPKNDSNTSSCSAECGGVLCDTCGGSPQCNDLVSAANEALAVSRQVRLVAESLRNNTLQRVLFLRQLFAEVSELRNDSLSAEDSARQIQLSARGLLQEVTRLRDNLQSQLEEGIIGDDVIEDIERETLSLSLAITEDEFLELLVAINDTVDMIFSRFGVNSSDLRQRADDALNRAQIVNSLADQLAGNVSGLNSILTGLRTQEQIIINNLTLAQSYNNDTQLTIDQTTSTLDETNTSLLSTRDRLTNLSSRLDQLELQLTQNLAALAVAENITVTAENTSTTVELSSQQLEAGLVRLQNASEDKVRESQEQLREAEEYRERMTALLERTTQQLLLEENLERREKALQDEQEFIRGDVRRLSLQLEELNELIQVHIARNTACLDGGSLQKR